MIEYISDQLRQGNSLSRLLSESLDLSDGRTAAFLPPQITEVRNFRDGGILPQAPDPKTFTAGDGRRFVISKIPTAAAEFTEYISNYLTLNDDNLCIFEDAVSSPIDGWLSSSGTNVMTFNNEVYHWLSSSVDKEKISTTIRRAQSWRLIGCLTSFPNCVLSFFNKATIDTHELDVLVANTKQLIVGVFDKESYLIWNRKA